MSKTNAERQAEYRKNAAENGDRRINNYVSAECYRALELMAAYNNQTMREVLESLINKSHARYCIDLPQEEFERYNAGKKAH